MSDAQTADAIRRTASLEGIYTETAGGVTIAAAEAARRRGVIRDGDEVVALLTGNGLKTPDAVKFGIEDRPAAPALPATHIGSRRPASCPPPGEQGRSSPPAKSPGSSR